MCCVNKALITVFKLHCIFFKMFVWSYRNRTLPPYESRIVNDVDNKQLCHCVIAMATRQSGCAMCRLKQLISKTCPLGQQFPKWEEAWPKNEGIALRYGSILHSKSSSINSKKGPRKQKDFLSLLLPSSITGGSLPLVKPRGFCGGVKFLLFTRSFFFQIKKVT